MKFAIKLGGSVITYKDANKPKAREDVIKRLISEVSKFPPPFILTHGAGSYGHPLVDKWMKGELRDFNEIHKSVEKLNEIILGYCKKFNLPVDCFPPFKTVTYNGKFDLKELWKYGKESLENGRVLMTYGDIVLPREGTRTKYNGFEILSADVSTCFLAKQWKAERIIWVVDKDGIYTKNPELYADSKVIIKINGKDYKARFETNKIDFTGGLQEKIKQSLKVGIESLVINGLVPRNLLKTLNGDKTIGTLIIP